MVLGRSSAPVAASLITAVGSQAFAVPTGIDWQLFSFQVAGLYDPFTTVSVAISPQTGAQRVVLDGAAVPKGSAVPVFVGDHVLKAGDSVRVRASAGGRAVVYASYDAVAAAQAGLRREMVPITSTSETDIATVPAGKRWRVLGLQASGLQPPESLLTLHLHTAGAGGGDRVMLSGARVPDARAVPLMTGGWVFEPGDRLTAELDAAPAGTQGVNVYLSVDEQDA